MKRFIIGFGWLMAACVAIAGTGTSNEFRVDTRTGDRVSAGTEELTFSNLWDGDADATVTIEQDGAAIYEGLSGEGVKTWTVDRNGRYVLTHTTYTNGVAGKVETAVFVVEGKEVPVGELTVAWEAGSFMYDNNGKTPGVTAKNGDQVLEKGVDYTVHYEGNTNAGTAKAILTGLPPYVGAVTNEFAIAKRSVELTSGSASKPYDGTALVCHSVTTNGNGFVAGEGIDFTFTGSQLTVGSSKNTFDYALKTGTQAGNYTITKTEGDLTVTAAPIGPGGGGGEEPGSGEIPEGGLSKFDATYVYDGEGHTINTQALYSVTLVGSTPSFSFSLDGETGWQNDPFVYTNVGEYVMWYKITAPNYADYKHQAKVTIQPLVLTVTFDANGGSCPMASKTVTHGATYGTLPTPTWTGHIFAGWYTAANGGDEVKDSTAVSIMVPQTLYAHWVSVTGVSAKQRYPWNGLIDIAVAFAGESNDVAKVDCSFIATNSATKAELSVASITRKGADSGKDNAWSRQFVWNAGTDVGAVKIDDVAFTVFVASQEDSKLGGVQLWENGPYWAECNVGATDSTEVGLHFWWGDTVGAVSTEEASSSECVTFAKSAAWLRSNGYIDVAGDLVSAHDAASVTLGEPWRMPTYDELSKLITMCSSRWVETSWSKQGRLVTGIGAYSSKSIYLPADVYEQRYGFAYGSAYWSSSVNDVANGAFGGALLSNPSSFVKDSAMRFARTVRCSVRPVRSPTYNIKGLTHLVLDCREGDRLSAGTEELTFSNLWDGDAEATVTIEQDGAAIYEGLSGEGVKTWTVDRNGRYVLTHTTYTNGVAGKVETAVFVVEGKDVPVSELTVAWEAGSFMYDNNGKTPGVTAKNGDQLLVKGVDYTVHYEGNTNAGTAKAILTGLPPYVGAVTNEFAIAKRSVELTSGSASKPYDGTALVCHSVTTNGDGFVSGEGVDFTFTGSQTIAGLSKNTFAYALKTGTLAGNYTITKTEGDLEVTSGEIVNPFDPDDPSKPVTPEVLAKANCITNYDGDGHSIEVAAILNPLIAANNPKITYSLLREGTYEAKNPTFTNVVSTSVWYRIEADNFSLFSTNALLKILPRSIANVDVAAIGDQTYTGSGIEPIPAVTDMRTLIGMSESTDILTSADYDLSYLNNTNVGTAKIVLSGKNNYEGSQTNTFQIVPAIIPLGPDGAIVTTGYTNAYDGAAHGVSVSATGLKTQPTVQYKGSLSAEWQSDSPTYTDVCDTQVWWKVSAPNYQSVEGTIGLKITQAANAWTVEPAIEGWTYGETAKTPVGAAKFGTVSFAYSPMPVGAAGDYTMTATVAGTANYTGLSKSVDFTIAKGSLPPGDDPDPLPPGVDPDDPGQREDPTIPFSAFDYVGMYDGVAHTIDTNALKVAYATALGEGVACMYARAQNGVWTAEPLTFKDVGVTSFWYKVTSANYADIVKPCKVAITNRPVTVTSGTKLDFTYDGKPHAFTNLMVTAGSFVAGEGIATSNWATVTTVAEGEVSNTFDYMALDGTKLENYDLTVVTGKIAVVSPDAVVVTITGHVASVTYDGTKKSVSGYDVVSISDSLYTAADFKFVGQSVTNGTNAGTYPMGLKSSDFVNTNANFSSVVFNVTDGQLVIAQAANAWTTEPAIEGWAYGETAKTPVGAAKFGTVTFAYSPMPVGAVGDYTMTATVAVTANYTGLSKSVGFKISKGALPGGGEEPGSGSVPEGGVSKFDAVAMYDGEGHTIKTNELVAAFKAAVGGDVTVRYGVADGEGAVVTQWLPIAPDFTNVCETSVWYKVTSANYADIVKPCKVAITNRPVTVTSGTKLDFAYDGQPHAYTNLTVTAGSFVAGEGIATSNWATVTTVAEGEVPNAFDYVALDGTKLANYDLTIVTGKIAVVSPDAVVVTVTGHVAKVVYDGTKKSVSGYDVVSISDSLYTAADFKFVGQSVTNGTDAGTYPMGLKSSDFVNTNANFSSVVFNVTDGRLVIAQAANAWTVEPAIEGWTYGETAKAPVGAAKFGTVTFAYSPMPVGAAGDYTMTATVAATANYTGLSKSEDFTIAKGSLPPSDDPDPTDPSVDPDDPGQREDPTIPFSAFDYVGMYDGVAHTIDTNALKVAYATALGEGVACMYARAQNGVWTAEPLTFKDAVVTSFWYKVTSANYADIVKPCKVAITNRPVTLTSGTKIDFIYDGKPHAFTNLTVTAGSFVSGEGIATSNWAMVTTVAEGEVPNAFDYVALDGTKLENYDLTVVTGKIAVVKGPLSPGDDPDPTAPSVDPDDPGQREDPAILFSVFDYVGMYDGVAHTIDTNALKAAYATALGEGVACMYARAQNGVWTAEPLTFKDAVVTSFWYKVTNANYADIVKPCKVAITNRPVTVTSGTKLDFTYDGKSHAYTNLTVTAGSFVAGEGIATSNWATVTTVAEGEVPNAFDYVALDGTKLSNYDLTVVTGKIAVVKGPLSPGDDPDPTAPSVDPDDPGQREDPTIPFSAFDYVGMYDGAAHTIDTNALKAAYATALGEGVACMYARAQNGVWTAEPLTFKDAVVTSFWYKVTSANYADIVKPCKVAITNRPVTVTSGTKLDFTYDGKPHAFTNLTVTAGSFVAGEGIATSDWATVTAVAEGQVPNSFDYVALDGTKLSNYDLTVVTGKIAVVMPPVSTVKVVLDAIGGKVQGKNVVTQDVVGIYGTLPDASRENYIFDGWFLGVSNDSPQAVSGGAVLTEGNHTLFARWSYDPSVTPDPTTIYKWEAIDANTARITGFLNANQQLQKMVLPDRIGGRFVTEIGASAFANTKCGVKELVLPMFCVVIDSKAFLGIETLETVTFATARLWNDPFTPASVAIGTYAFSGAKALASIMLCKEIASLGNYAFLNTRNLSSITILGKPTVGTQVFRSSGMDAGGVTIHLDPALASDTAYMAALKANMSNVTVKTDAIVTSLTMSTLGMRGTSVRLTVSVEKAAEWGQVDLGAIRVKYRNTLSDPATVLTPTAATRNADGTVTLEVAPPEGTSGFFQTIIKR